MNILLAVCEIIGAAVLSTVPLLLFSWIIIAHRSVSFLEEQVSKMQREIIDLKYQTPEKSA